METYGVAIKGIPCQLVVGTEDRRVTATHKDTQNKYLDIDLADVVAATVEPPAGISSPPKAADTVYVTAIIIKGGHSVIQVYTITSVDSAKVAIAINDKIPRSGFRRLLLISNPFSGKKTARHMVNEVTPLFQLAGVSVEVVETKASDPNHLPWATDFCRELDLSKYDCLVCVSGDGVLHEMINGLMRRSDWETAIKTPLSFLPSGSGNGMAQTACLSHRLGEKVVGALSCVRGILNGVARPLDISSVFVDETRFYSHLSIEWAMAGDVDIGSEAYRWMGPMRFTFAAVLACLKKPKYSGSLYFLKDIEKWEGSCTGATCACADNIPEIRVENGAPACDLLNNAKPEDWQKIEGNFALYWSMSVAWAASDSIIAPSACLSNGRHDATVIMHSASRMALVKWFLGLETGEQVKLKEAMQFRTRALRIEPKSSKGWLAIDGESVPNKAMRLEVHRGLARIVCPL